MDPAIVHPSQSVSRQRAMILRIGSVGKGRVWGSVASEEGDDPPQSVSRQFVRSSCPPYQPHRESRPKAILCICRNRWADKCGQEFKYFMVFENDPPQGACTFNQLLEILKEL